MNNFVFNSKSFTLFTALVAFILIALSALLVQGMIKAERDKTDMIYNVEEQATMQAIADMERADALQTFNYLTRFYIEDWINRQEYIGPINAIQRGKEWGEVEKDFSKLFTGEQGQTQLASQMANSLINLHGERQVGI